MGNLKCICIPASSPKHQRCGNSSWESNFYQGVLIPPSLADNQFRHIQNNSNIQQSICQPLRISRFVIFKWWFRIWKSFQNAPKCQGSKFWKKTPFWTRSHRCLPQSQAVASVRSWGCFEFKSGNACPDGLVRFTKWPQQNHHQVSQVPHI